MSNDPYHAGTADELPSIEEQLVAYLDGELDDESSRSLEQRLATDSTLRLQLGRLERTWDLLDQLGRAEVGETFTRTTIEMKRWRRTGTAVGGSGAADPPPPPLLRRRRDFASSAAGLFWFARPNPNRQLLETCRFWKARRVSANRRNRISNCCRARRLCRGGHDGA